MLGVEILWKYAWKCWKIVYYRTEVWSEKTQRVWNLQVRIEDEDLQTHELSYSLHFSVGELFVTTKTGKVQIKLYKKT